MFETCLYVTDWLKGQIARSLNGPELSTDESVRSADEIPETAADEIAQSVDYRQDYHHLTRLQLICQYARYSSLSLLMFCSHDHGMYRKQLIEGVEYLCELCGILAGSASDIRRAGIFRKVMANRKVHVPEVYGFLKYFATALLAAAAVLSYYCPLPYNVSELCSTKLEQCRALHRS